MSTSVSRNEIVLTTLRHSAKHCRTRRRYPGKRRGHWGIESHEGTVRLPEVERALNSRMSEMEVFDESSMLSRHNLVHFPGSEYRAG